MIENEEAEDEANDRADLAIDGDVDGIAGLKRFVVESGTDGIDGAGKHEAEGVRERQHEDGATEDGENHQHAHNKGNNMGRQKRTGAFLWHGGIDYEVLKDATDAIKNCRKNR